MVKDTVAANLRETTIKQRRKTVPTDNAAEVDVYKRVIDFEEKEALSRSAETDANLHFETCKSIRKLLSEMSDLKIESSPDSRAKVSEKCTHVCTLIAVLKKLNRLEKFRVIGSRDTLTTEKQKVDSTHLQYQNLMYEEAHLISEYNKCKQFKSKDEDIELIPLAHFLEQAPETISKPFNHSEPYTNAQEHELHLARLEWELTQRKQLAELCKTFENEKKQLAGDIVERRNRLEGLGPRLAVVLDATVPLQEHLGLPVEKIRAEHKHASLLPDPLYLFYANADAYQQVFDIDLSIQILGDQDEAKQWNEMEKTFMPVYDSDHETEHQEIEETVEVKKRRHRRTSHVDRHEEKKKKLLEAHPLSIQITLRFKDDFVLKVQFFYRHQLKIITVMSNVEIPSSLTTNAAREVLLGESVLAELFEGDFGIESPNPGNHYQLKKVGLGSYQSLIPTLGYCYSWAQRICGFDFLPSENKMSVVKLSRTNVEIIMKLFNRRLRSRAALAIQLQQLEQKLIPILLDSVQVPRNAISALTHWASTTWQIFCLHPSTASLVENEIIAQNDLFYTATVSRLKANLQVMIAIKNDYPFSTPIFSLTLQYNGEFHAGNCDEIRDMERAVNSGWSNNLSSAGWLLAAQFRHLCAYMDVYLESIAPTYFPQNTVFFKNICARNRRRPFKFRKVGAGIFTQY